MDLYSTFIEILSQKLLASIKRKFLSEFLSLSKKSLHLPSEIDSDLNKLKRVSKKNHSFALVKRKNAQAIIAHKLLAYGYTTGN